ncbi:MAG: class I adenylate-forming enzyme family protein [Bacillota bacterium]|nr:class I adenylate-forming enzyme family protein [Bacillota bacterium]MDW7684878.1 class I adenylate-forming enzyme family protein [Bacillota bacterium]
MNLGAAFRLAVNRYPDVTAIVTGKRKVSYREWGQRVCAVAQGLARAGIQTGDRVAICAGSGELPATAFFAVHSLDAVAVMINTRWKSGDIAYALKDSCTKAVFYDAAARSELHKIVDQFEDKLVFIADVPGGELQTWELSFSHLAEPASGQWPHIPQQGNETGTILYTSGTTGRPKGVCRSPISDYFAALAIILEHRWTRFERILAVMPLYHTMGLHTLISQVLLNATAVIPEKAKPENYCKFLEAGQVSALYLVPTMYHDLVEHVAGNRLPPIKKLAFAGAPMDSALQETCRELFMPDTFINQYGCTEMIAITINDRLKQKPLSAGRTALQSRIRIVGLEGFRQDRVLDTVCHGAVGEILVDTTLPQAFLGYLGRREASEHVLCNGWYFTGDLGFLDEEGDLFLAGRVDDMIISGGENIYPYEVEEILLKCHGVKEAAVVGAPDVRWGERVVAFVVPTDRFLTKQQLERFVLHHPELARFKRPREFILVQEIPKSPTGKVLRSLLKSDFEP